MKSDIQGVSQCPAGEESYEAFEVGTKKYLQYDYRSQKGRLFTGIFLSGADARKERDEWLKRIGEEL